MLEFLQTKHGYLVDSMLGQRLWLCPNIEPEVSCDPSGVCITGGVHTGRIYGLYPARVPPDPPLKVMASPTWKGLFISTVELTNIHLKLLFEMRMLNFVNFENLINMKLCRLLILN